MSLGGEEAQFGGRKTIGANHLKAMRILTLAFIGPTVVMAVVVAVFAGAGNLEKLGQMSAPVVAVALLAYGLVPTVLATANRPPLDCGSPESLLSSYQTRFFLRIATAEAASILSFVGFILTSEPWIYAIGAGFALMNLWRIAPTERHLEADQQRLAESGCGLSLVEALQPPHSPFSTQ